jgi:lysosomal acid phosphatase
MIKFIYCLLIFLFFNSITISSHDISKLKLSLVIHRHGDRTPINCYPTDPYKNASYWLDGWGQLTNRGKDRMFKLGKYIRARYENFLGTSPREVHIRSSAADRCLESAALVSAAIYPPEGRWQWNTELGKSWQPFPIQTEPLPFDGMLNPGSKCPAADEELATIANSPAVQKYTNERKVCSLY